MRGFVGSKSVLVASSLVLASLGFSGVASAAPDDPVVFDDANLQACVNNTLGQGAADPVAEAQLAGLTNLNCDSRSITSLEGLQYAVGLQTLSLYNNEISDVGPLSELTGLQVLYLENNLVSELGPLSGLNSLGFLSLSNNQVRDVGPLSELTGLHSLWLDGNRIVDVSPLVNLTHVSGPGSLYLGRQQVSADPAYVGVPVGNPLRGVNGDVIDVAPDSYCYDDSCADLVYPDAGGSVAATWDKLVTVGAASAEFSGILTREVLASSAPTLSGTPDAGTVGASYSYAFAVTGTPTPTVTLTDGDLPAGLSLSGGGVLAGTPTTPGTHTFTLTASNGVDPAATLAVTLTINPAPAYVDFEDPNLQACVNSKLDQATDAPITVTQMETLDELSCGFSNVQKLGGLEYAVNLQTLYLYLNEIEDLTPLTNLIELQDLSMFRNKVDDLAPLANLRNLRDLNLDSNQISDLSPLEGLTNLEALSIGGNQINDLTTIEELTGLNTLWAEDNQIDDVTSLAGLTDLQTLELSNNQIDDLAPLQNLTHLERLDLSNNKVKDLEPLREMGVLHGLFLSGNQISDLAPLQNLASLTGLHLSDNQIDDVGPLSGLTGLQLLYLSRNHIADISPLAGLTNLDPDWVPIEGSSGFPSLALDGQLVTADPAVVGIPVGNPLRDASGGVVPVVPDSYCAGTDCGQMVYSTVGSDVEATWAVPVTIGAAHVTFSGSLTRDVVAAVPPVGPKKPTIANTGAAQILPIVIGGVVLLAGGLYLTYRSTRRK